MVSISSKKRPIAMVGAGSIVKDAHLPAYKKAGFEVKIIFDLDTEKAEIIANQFDIPVVAKSLKECISIARQNNCVFDLALPASAILDVLPYIPVGSGVLIQKPMGETLEQAQHILKLSRVKGLVAGVNFQLRKASFITAAKELINSGEIGQPHDIDIKMCVYTPWHLWEFLYELPRVEILYHSIHYIDLVRFFWGNPHSVYAKTIKHPKMRDLASTKSAIYLDYGEWKRATINTNHGHEFAPRHQESYIKFEGTEGAIKIRVGVNLNYPEGRKDVFEYICPSTNGSWKKKEVAGSWFPDAFVGPMAGLMKKLENPNYKYDNDLKDAIHTMRVVEAAYISSEQGGLRLPDRF